VDNNFSMLTSSDLLSKPVEDLKTIVKTKRNMTDAERAEEERREKARAKAIDEADAMDVDGAKAATSNGADISDVALVPKDEVTVLEGHTSEVFICAWSPAATQLASGGGDATARMWTVPAGPSGRGVAADAPPPLVLRHEAKDGKKGDDAKGDDEITGDGKNGRSKGGATKDEKMTTSSPVKKEKGDGSNKDGGGDGSEWANKSKDVTTLDWNGDGSLLATGSYDGLARVWRKDGTLAHVLDAHSGPIFSLKWNKKGDVLLSGSVDKTAVAWDAESGTLKQRFAFHAAPTLDVDWRDDTQFATSSMDHMIYVCELGNEKPVKAFKGHADEVNAIKWDPTGTLLASCSDDYTCKVWSLDKETCVHDFSDHRKEIYTIKWSPTGPGTKNPDLPLLLASASYDATVKLWDVEKGVCVHTLAAHTDPVYSVAFSPNGLYIASGSFDKRLHVWRVTDGKRVKTHKGEGGIFEVCWNVDGTKIAACYSNNAVNVIDFDAADASAK
jgi:transducin (beta)-like 1